MIKEALQYIVNLGKTEVLDIDGRKYTTTGIEPVKEPYVQPLCISTLTGLIDYIKSDIDGIKTPYLIEIFNPTNVTLCSPLYGKFEQRKVFVKVEAQLPRIPLNEFLPQESFIISLQSCFVRNDSEKYKDIFELIRCASSVSKNSEITAEDNGITQSASMKSGVYLANRENLPNPVILEPYRTFLEVDQPHSEFVFRVQDGPRFGLFEADGGAWKAQSIQNIKEYLKENLTGYPVHIIA
jgi:hypothetical protein